jgi:hypothetical protein
MHEPADLTRRLSRDDQRGGSAEDVRSGMSERSGADPDVPEVAILIGLQGSGKSTFFGERLTGTHVHVSKDRLRKGRRRQERQMRMIEEALTAGLSVAVDNTNPSREEWDPLIAMARRHGAKVTGYWFPPDVPRFAAAQCRPDPTDPRARRRDLFHRQSPAPPAADRRVR